MAQHPPSARAVAAISDLLDNCAQLRRGQRVIIAAALDGLFGGTNLVEERVVDWLHAGVAARGGHSTIIWTEVNAKQGSLRVPPIIKAALKEADVLINHIFDMPMEELLELRAVLADTGVTMVRNMATTAPLLASDWAQMPHELVSKIRSLASQMIEPGAAWVVEHPNGTQMKGIAGPPKGHFSTYDQPRSEYRPFPEGVFPPIQITETAGRLVFDRTLSWWSRFVGLPARFQQPIELTVENSHIQNFQGGEEAKILERFVSELAKRVGKDAYRIAAYHGGVHPNASVGAHQCADANYREFIEHHHSGSSHFHIGSAACDPTYPYFLHLTAELRGATFRVGGNDVYKNGHLAALDDPTVIALAKTYGSDLRACPEDWVWVKP